MNKDQKKKLSREKRRLQKERRARLEKDIDEIIEAELDIDDVFEDEPLIETKEIEDEPVVEEAVAETKEVVADDEVPIEKETPSAVDALVLETTLARDKRIMSSSKGIKGVVEKTIRSTAQKIGLNILPDKNMNSTQIEKDANGDWRMVSWVSNKWLDRDNEIICEDAHKEYVEWVNANPEFMPASLSWHIPETVRKNNVDFIDYIDGFLVASVKLTEEEAVGLLELSKEVNLGMSHGSLALARDPNDKRIITKYRMYEVSDLPLKNAANPFTDLETISKEVGMDKKEYLTKILGAEKAEAYLEKIGLAKQALEDAQIESKEVTVETTVSAVVETPVVAETVADTQSELLAKVLKELDIDGLNEFVSKAQEAMEKIPVLEDLVKELSGNQEEKLAELIDPPISKKMAWSRPSESTKNLVKEGDEKDNMLVSKRPEMWLSELTGTEPITIEES